jgi:amino acid transporter
LLYNAHGGVLALQQKLLLLVVATFIVAFLCVLFFSYRRSKKIQLPFWSKLTRRLILSIAIPFIAGSFIILWALNNQLYFLLVPLSLIIYGIAIFCGSRYTTDEARYLAVSEMFLGCLALWLPADYGLLMWSVGFGVLHIIYGAVMWSRYERKK